MTIQVRMYWPHSHSFHIWSHLYIWEESPVQWWHTGTGSSCRQSEVSLTCAEDIPGTCRQVMWYVIHCGIASSDKVELQVNTFRRRWWCSRVVGRRQADPASHILLRHTRRSESYGKIHCSHWRLSMWGSVSWAIPAYPTGTDTRHWSAVTDRHTHDFIRWVARIVKISLTEKNVMQL